MVPVIEVESVVTQFGAQRVHDGVSFSVERGSILALIGGSGSGKSTLLREIIGLLQPTSGDIRLLGYDVWHTAEAELNMLRRRIGVLFQDGALFSSLTVGENVAAPLREQARLPDDIVVPLVQLRLGLAGLDPTDAFKMPSELSGGMRKRVALARALALEPEVLFLDEPTSGLDPINARAFDSLIQTLSRNLGLTIFMVTHDLDSLFGIANRVIVLGGGRVIEDGTTEQVAAAKDPWVQSYFSSRR